MKTTISALVEGGKATGGPPLGPALGPLGVNIKGVVDEINEKTKNFLGLKVPVKVIVDKVSRKFEIEVGTPPVSALIKKELNIEKGAKARGEKAGNLTFQQVVKIAKMKTSLAKGLKEACKEVLGTAVSMGVSCEERDPKEIIKEINNGRYDEEIK